MKILHSGNENQWFLLERLESLKKDSKFLLQRRLESKHICAFILVFSKKKTP